MLVRTAWAIGVVDWLLDMPGDDQSSTMTGVARGEGESYLFPRHPSEFDRLDVQHHALRMVLGVNHLAPIGSPRRILDSGSGTGQWAYELCADFRHALVVGLDLRPGKSDQPGNFRFVRGNLLDGLPFASDQFDFVHQRLLVPAIPMRHWSTLIRELVRVVRPGGWIELVEADWMIEPAGPSTMRIIELAGRLGRSLGLDTTGSIFRSLDQHLARAGLTKVVRRTVDMPLGEWGGQPGSLMASDFRAAATRLRDAYQARFPQPADHGNDLIRTASQEWGEQRSTCTFAFAFGRKPVG